ncbi:MAG: phytase [Cyclobacteriaceae bacterium]|nr:phytase [Cyclobacteriaceae bacterium HetDA_MAG_MS6]
MNLHLLFLLLILLSCCTHERKDQVVKPLIITEKVKHDSDDPAIWVNNQHPSESLVIGTDKGGDSGDGALYAFDLQGKTKKRVGGISRPNNVDIAQNVKCGDTLMDIAVCTERYSNKIRIFSLPDLIAVDNGGIQVFEDEEQRDPMGLSLYQQDSSLTYAIVGRKSGPTDGSYLWQYRLIGDNSVVFQGELVRKFGKYSGVKEIEAIAVDREMGYIYYSDETVGIRKYFADPAKGNMELALFGKENFVSDHEGISIYKTNSRQGFLIVSDQQSNEFHIYKREGTVDDPHNHPLLAEMPVLAVESDGNEITSQPLSQQFKNGLFVAMSDDGTFHYYDPHALLSTIIN